MRPRLRVLAVLLAAVPVLRVHAGAPEGVPFGLIEDGTVVVPIVIDGRGPVPFMLDTGASGSTVFGRLARDLALAPVARTSVISAVGRHDRVVVRLGRVSLGDAQVQDLLPSLEAAPQLDLGGVTVQGILGQDFLSRFDYTLDYRRRRIVWASAGGGRAAGNDERLTLCRSEGRFLVELPQGDNRLVHFVPDSGTNALVVFDRPGAWTLPADPVGGRYEISDLSGRRGVETRRIRELQIGGYTLRNQVAAVLSRPRGTPSEEDGLLPLHLFASVTFHSQEGYMVIRAR